MGIYDSVMQRYSFFANMLLREKRNLYNIFGYNPNPDFQARLNKYLRQDIAGRVVDAPAAALWTNPPQVTSTSPEWNAAWQDLVARHDLWFMLERIDRLCGIGRYAILLIGYNDGRKLSEPVDKRRLERNKAKILYVQPYSEVSAQIESYNEDATSEAFQTPLYYLVQPNMEKSLGFDPY